MKNDIAKAISISSIWLSTAIIFAFGIFDFNWNGEGAMALMLIISLSILLAASYSTKVILNSRVSSTEKEQVESGI